MWFSLLELSSAFMCLSFFAIVYFNKQLQVHPMRLIMYIALAESGYQYFLIQQFQICDFHLNWLFAWTFFYSNDAYYLFKSNDILTRSCIFGASFCIEFGILLNICLCIDLILMVRYPFESTSGRVNKYLIISFILALIPASFEDF